MRKLTAAVMALVLVAALSVTHVGAGVLPPLTVDPTEGDPGDTIDAQVDTVLVASNCITETAAAQAEAGTQAGLWSGFNTAASRPNSPPVTNYEEGAGFVGVATLFTIAADPSSAEALLPNTFILSFADIGTGQPLGLSNFDPATGAGSIEVPDGTEPGLYAVAATCIFPQVTQASYDAAIAAIAAQMEADLGPFDFATFNGAIATHAATYGPAIIQVLAAPQDGAGPWTATYTVVDALPPLDPMTEAFCGVLLEFAGIEAVITEALSAIPEDDGSQSNVEWADGYDWEAIEATLREMGETVQSLLDTGDESRVEAVADDWVTVTAQVRDLLNALEAVDYDLSSPTGRQIAGQLTGGAGGDPDPAVEAATEALTAFAVSTCFPAQPTATPDSPTAPAAQPTTAQPRFTG